MILCLYSMRSLVSKVLVWRETPLGWERVHECKHTASGINSAMSLTSEGVASLVTQSILLHGCLLSLKNLFLLAAHRMEMYQYIHVEVDSNMAINPNSYTSTQQKACGAPWSSALTLQVSTVCPGHLLLDQQLRFTYVLAAFSKIAQV